MTPAPDQHRAPLPSSDSSSAATSPTSLSSTETLPWFGGEPFWLFERNPDALGHSEHH